MNEANLKAYNSGTIVNWYDQLGELTPAETAILTRYSNALAQSDVLDLGIGGGRTTAYLAPRCRHYTGIDYSERFVSLSKKKYPGKDIRLMNATDLSDFNPDRFHFVNFSLNGLDYVPLSDRKKILSEIHKVLSPGGIFFFSTHNKDHRSFNRSPWLDSTLTLSIRIKTFARLAPFYFRHLSQKKKEERAENYAVINDWAHEYRLLTFYTSPAFLREQLALEGFVNIVFHSANGLPEADSKLDNWIFVTCEKQA